MNISPYLKLYLVLETPTLRLPLGDFIAQAVEGGVTAIQLRDKSATGLGRYNTAGYIKTLTAKKDILFIINNNADIARAVGAHGVHLGPDDLPPAAVKAHFPELLVGVSCNNDDDCVTANTARADYAGAGPAFFTATKTNLRPVIGPEGIKNITARLDMPAVAIGGIAADNIAALKGCGLAGFAVSSALCRSETPYDAALALRRLADEIVMS